MIIRSVTENDAEDLYRMLCLLDEETDFMMYEPGERREKTPDLTQLNASIKAAVSGQDLMLIAVNEDGRIAGFLHAERGIPNRISHTAYVVVGIRRAFRRQGIGTEFFSRLDIWAKQNGLVRLELTVECPNTGARELYEKQGFAVEGIRRKSMKINGRFVDEYYMSKIVG